MGHSFLKHLANRALAKGETCSAPDAMRLAAERLGLPIGASQPIVPLQANSDGSFVLSCGAFSEDPVTARLVYVAEGSERLRLAWTFCLRPPGSQSLWEFAIDAHDGSVCLERNLAKRASFRVVDLPGQNPFSAPRTLVTAREDALASPFGWHDTDAVPGPESTLTTGNNIRAQPDLAGDNSTGVGADGGSSLVYDFPLDFAALPTANPAAPVAQAFYIGNVLHDIFYQYGFDEASGNFQDNNYGRGGAGNDALRIDVHDANANASAFYIPAVDGQRARVEMGVSSRTSVIVDAGGSDQTGYFATSAEFGPSLTGAGVTGLVIQALDAANVDGPASTDACSPLSNAAEIDGNIALIDRGSCNFTDKVKNAQDAGAIAAIVVNNAGDELIGMLGVDASITIPSLFIDQSNGDALKAQLGSGVTATLHPSADTALDNAVLIHEFAHGVTDRLTGGAMDVSCLLGVQSRGMSEGWSDWFTLVMTAKPSDTAELSRPFATYSFGLRGVRSSLYTTDFTVNSLTYAQFDGDNSEHAIGEIWCATLWDMYWNLVETHGFDSDLYTGNGGNNIALQLVIDGLKLQNCSPTFLDARDAILLADQVNNNSANHCLIWKAFAKRGMGVNADDGGSHNSVNVTEDFAVPASCKVPLITSISETPPFAISWESLFNGAYQIQSTANLPSAGWSDVAGANLVATGINSALTLPTSAASRLFYRVVLDESPQPQSASPQANNSLGGSREPMTRSLR